MTERPAVASRAWSIQTLLVGQFLVVVLVAAVVVTGLVIGWRLPMVQQQAQAEQNRLADVAQYQVELNLDLAERRLMGMAYLIRRNGPDHPLTRQLFASLQLALDTQVQDVFQATYLLDGDLRVLDVGGEVAAADRAQWLGNDLSGLAVVQKARQLGRLAWSDRYTSPVLGEPVVAMAVPVAEGVLLAELSVDQLARAATQAVSLDGVMVLLLDGHAEVIASPDMDLARVRSNMARWPVIARGLAGERLFGLIELGDERHQGTTRLLQRLGWLVFAGVPQKAIDASRNAAIGITAITLVLAVGVGFALFARFSWRLKRRLTAFGAYAEAVAQGRFDRGTSGEAQVRELDTLDRSLTRMAQTIERRERQLRSIVDTTPTLAIQWFDRRGRVVDWNPASEAVLGWSRDEALGKTLEDLIYTPEQQAEFMRVIADIEHTGQPFGPYSGEVRNRAGDTRVILSTTFGVPDVSGGQLFVCMDVDITELKRQEAVIRASEQKFNLFFQASPVAVAVVEDLGAGRLRHVDVNRRWERLFGRDRAAALAEGLEVAALLENPTDLDLDVSKLPSGKVIAIPPVWMKRADGQLFLAQGAAANLQFDGGQYVLYAAHDVTAQWQAEQDLRELNAMLEERIAHRTESLSRTNRELEDAVRTLKDAQERLVRSDKLASLGALVAGVAHELNTPIGNGLMAVSTLAQRLKDFRQQMAQGLRKSDLERLLAQVDTAADISTRNLGRASELISSFKQVAVDQTSSQRRRFDLHQVVHEILLTLQPAFRHTAYRFDNRVPAGLVLDSFPGPLGQVVANLVQNAVLHGFAGRDAGCVAVEASVSDDRVTLVVRDDGVGIPAEHQGRVFDPFFTTRLGQGGSGLGLNIVHNIVTGLLGGRIQLVVPEGGGTEMRIDLPMVAPVPTAPSSPGVDARPG